LTYNSFGIWLRLLITCVYMEIVCLLIRLIE